MKALRSAAAALTLVTPALAVAAEPPESHPSCLEEAAPREVRDERVHSNWPDGSVKSKQINFTDGTYVQVHYHANGTMKLESEHAVILIDGDPRRRRHVQHGTEKRWHENGQLFVCAVYVEGKKQGTWIYYRDDGTPASSFTYEDDREVEHLTYSTVFGWQPFEK